MRPESLDFAAEMPSARFPANEKPYFLIRRVAEDLGIIVPNRPAFRKLNRGTLLPLASRSYAAGNSQYQWGQLAHRLSAFRFWTLAQF